MSHSPLFEQAAELETPFAELLHTTFADHPKVVDVRTIGMMGGVELEPRAGAPGVEPVQGRREAACGRIVSTAPLEMPSVVIGTTRVRFEGGRVATMTIIIDPLGRILGVELEDEA